MSFHQVMKNHISSTQTLWKYYIHQKNKCVVMVLSPPYNSFQHFLNFRLFNDKGGSFLNFWSLSKWWLFFPPESNLAPIHYQNKQRKKATAKKKLLSIMDFCFGTDACLIFFFQSFSFKKQKPFKILFAKTMCEKRYGFSIATFISVFP